MNREQRICHDNIEVEAAVIFFIGAKFAQALPAVVVDVAPIFGDGFVPTTVIERVQVQDVGFAVARD